MAKYRKKSVIIDAIQFDGDNYKECKLFIDGNFDNTVNYPNVKILEGIMKISKHDFIIKGIKGEFYPCKPDIFKKTHEDVELPKIYHQPDSTTINKYNN